MSEVEAAETNDVNEEKAEPRTYSEEQFSGLLADKQAEVKKRQELERKLSEMEAGMNQDNTPTAGDNAGKSPDDDRPMTVSEFRRLMAEERKADADAAFAVRELQSREAAVKEYTAERCGEGLDYESVIAAGERSLTEGDRLAIRQAKDPAAEKYRRCVMLSPELREKAETFRTSKLLEKIKLTGRVPATGGGQVSTTAEDVGRMSEEELDRLAESLN
jgi:hypothetical protein